VNEKVWWYLARASGLAAWALLLVAVLWGLLLSTRLLQDKRRPAWLLDLHRWLGGLAVSFTGIHVIGLVADSYEHFGWKEILVPYASEWRPAAVAWGVVGLYLLLAVQITSLLMRRLPRQLWKRVHYLSFFLLFIATMHSALAGTDTSSIWYRTASAIVISATLVVSLYRFLAGRRPAGQKRARSKENVQSVQSAGSSSLAT
jgi:predicted ferric reductase